MITFHPLGPFSLTAAVAFAEDLSGTRAEGPLEALRYAWAVDGDWHAVQVTVRQEDEAIHAELSDQPPAELARQAARDLERMLSLDVDGTDFAALGERADVVRALHAASRAQSTPMQSDRHAHAELVSERRSGGQGGALSISPAITGRACASRV